MFLSCFIILLPVVQKISQKWKIAIFLEFFHLFYHVFHFSSVFIIFASSGAIFFKKMENCNVPRVFIIFLAFFYFFLSFFIIVLSFFSCFIMFASSGAKMMKNDKKMKKKEKNEENCNFPFCGKCLHHWKQTWWKIIKNMIKNIKKIKTCKKNEKTRKIAIFHFLENFCTTGSKNDEKWLKNNKKW